MTEDRSYKRQCKDCGRWIQLRRMPHGQWLAFEGFDTPHDCSRPPVRSRTVGEDPRREQVFGSLTFDTFEFRKMPNIFSDKPKFFPAPPPKPKPEKVLNLYQTRLKTLKIAIREHRVIALSRSCGGTLTQGEFEPVKMKGTSCYGYCRVLNRFTIVRQNEIRELKLEDATFADRKLAPAIRPELNNFRPRPHK